LYKYSDFQNILVFSKSMYIKIIVKYVLTYLYVYDIVFYERRCYRMSIEHKLVLSRWETNGWKIEVIKGKVYAFKHKNKLFLGLTSQL